MKIPYYMQVQYARLIGPKYDRFTVKNNNPFLATCRCPKCGDSQKSKIKARFYFYSKGQSVLVACHNCGYGTNIVGFIKDEDEFLYRELIKEAFTAERILQPIEEKKEEVKRIVSDDWRDCLVPAAMSPVAVKMLQKRVIPKKQWCKLYYTKNLKATYVDICNTLNIEVDKSKQIPEMEGLFMPFLDADGSLLFSATRNLDETSSMRYVTIEFQEAEKVFGLGSVDSTKTVYVTEGPIDSLFLNNCVATGDAALDKASRLISKDMLVLFPDNEPRAPVQADRIKRFIDSGFSVVLLPHYIKEKDVNDMVKAGYDVQALAEKYTFKGLMAKLEYKKWRLC